MTSAACLAREVLARATRGPHFMLTQETAISYLLRRGDLTLAELVESEVNVFDVSRRNGNFLVERRRG